MKCDYQGRLLRQYSMPRDKPTDTHAHNSEVAAVSLWQESYNDWLIYRQRKVQKRKENENERKNYTFMLRNARLFKFRCMMSRFSAAISRDNHPVQQRSTIEPSVGKSKVSLLHVCKKGVEKYKKAWKTLQCSSMWLAGVAAVLRHHTSSSSCLSRLSLMNNILTLALISVW